MFDTDSTCRSFAFIGQVVNSRNPLKIITDAIFSNEIYYKTDRKRIKKIKGNENKKKYFPPVNSLSRNETRKSPARNSSLDILIDSL